MLLASFEPGKEMAIANFSLAIFCLFTVALPLILITRGDKTEANRNFLAATINPWSQDVREAELIPVVVSENTSTITIEPPLAVVPELVGELSPESEKIISLEIKGGDKLDESSTLSLTTTEDEMLAA